MRRREGGAKAMQDDEGWRPPGSRRDEARIDADWRALPRPLIDGVTWRETAQVSTGYGRLVELFRGDWDAARRGVDQVFASHLEAGRISAWHAHEHTLDRIAVAQGTLQLVLYDLRPGSPTHGLLNEFLLSEWRPGTVTIPPRVWHGVRNPGPGRTLLVNVVDRAYDYGAPDHWRLPVDSTAIPFRFPG